MNNLPVTSPMVPVASAIATLTILLVIIAMFVMVVIGLAMATTTPVRSLQGRWSIFKKPTSVRTSWLYKRILRLKHNREEPSAELQPDVVRKYLGNLKQPDRVFRQIRQIEDINILVDPNQAITQMVVVDRNPTALPTELCLLIVSFDPLAWLCVSKAWQTLVNDFLALHSQKMKKLMLPSFAEKEEDSFSTDGGRTIRYKYSQFIVKLCHTMLLLCHSNNNILFDLALTHYFERRGRKIRPELLRCLSIQSCIALRQLENNQDRELDNISQLVWDYVPLHPDYSASDACGFGLFAFPQLLDLLSMADEELRTDFLVKLAKIEFFRGGKNYVAIMRFLLEKGLRPLTPEQVHQLLTQIPFNVFDNEECLRRLYNYVKEYISPLHHLDPI